MSATMRVVDIRVRLAQAGGRQRAFACAILIGTLAASSGCGGSIGDETHKINGSVHVDANRPAGSAQTVNGSIQIDDNGKVTSAESVNGDIHLGAHASADDLKAVNGGIKLDAGAHVARSLKSVNGSITLQAGAEVLGQLQNVSGHIELNGAHVGGGIVTVAGDISILGPSHVEGGIVVKKPNAELISIHGDVPRIVIGPGATVQGEMRFEREVHLLVSDHATIGALSGATATTFTGDTPPK